MFEWPAWCRTERRNQAEMTPLSKHPMAELAFSHDILQCNEGVHTYGVPPRFVARISFRKPVTILLGCWCSPQIAISWLYWLRRYCGETGAGFNF